MNTDSTAAFVATQRPSEFWLAIRRVFFDRADAPASTQSLDTTALLERADAYESTQPGYAADLRAAALHVTATD